MKKITVAAACLFGACMLSAKDYGISSPDGRLDVNVSTGEKTVYSVSYDGTVILAPSPLSMRFDDGRVI